MHPKSSSRRTHGAEFKAQVLAECQQPGASVAAIALAHGLNVNLLRKWLVGRGLKRAGLPAPRRVSGRHPAASAMPAPALQFIPVELAAPTSPATAPITAPNTAAADSPAPGAETIHIELTRGATKLSVQWPAAQTEACSAWLRELAAVACKE